MSTLYAYDVGYPFKVTHFIRIENNKDFVWLQRLLARALDRTQTEPGRFNLEVSEHIQNLHKALENATHMEQTSSTKPKEKPKPATKKQEKIIQAEYCSEHPKFTGQRSPRTSCKTCWSVYKRLNPTRARLAERKFQRKQHG